MTSLNEALTLAAPLYNLLFVVIAVILFVFLFRQKKSQTFLLPWKLIFLGMSIFIFETIFTILRSLGVIHVPVHVNGFFELIIIVVFIYALLIQREHVINE